MPRMGRMGMGDESFNLKNSVEGLITIERTGRDLCLKTNSTIPCIVRNVVVYNETWMMPFNGFPSGNDVFEKCFDGNVVAISAGNKACLDLRVGWLCSLRTITNHWMGNCPSAWRCVKDQGEGHLQVQ